MQKIVKRKVKELAKKYNVSEKEIEELYNAQFKLIRQTIEEAEKGKVDTFKNIRLIKLGIFYVKDGIKKHLINKTKTNE